MNSVPCTLKAADPPMAGDTEGLCDDLVNISGFLTAPVLMDERMDLDACHRGNLRVRLWCLQDYEWLLPLVSVIAALGIVAVQYAWEKYGPKKTEQSPRKSSKQADNAEAKAGAAVPESKAAEVDTAAVAIAVHQEPEIVQDVPEGPPGDDKASVEASKSRAATKENFAELTDIASAPSPKKSKSHYSLAATSEAALGELTDIMSASPSAMKSKSHVELEVKSEAALEVSKPKSQAGKGANAPEIPEPEKPEKPHQMAATAPEKGEAVEVGPATATTARLAQMVQTRKAGNKYPLGLARFMGSSHVVAGHLFAKGVTHPVYFFGWGFTWVPWFFMLSGFVLFSAYLKNPKEETMIQYVLRRSTTIYPLYAFSLIPAFIMQKSFGTMSAEWPTLLAQSFLLQAWWPTFTENALQMHCWFLSCMVVYWFFFKPLAYLLKNVTLKRTVGLMGFFFFLPWLLVLIPVMANQPVDWYKDHDFLSTDTALDIGVVMLKFHPVCYFHVFILGMLLAKLRQLLDKKALACGHAADSFRNPYLIALQFVAPLGYLFLILVFSVEGFQARLWGYKLSARISVLLPFQAMILFGLAGLPSLPLPLFSYAFSPLAIQPS